MNGESNVTALYLGTCFFPWDTGGVFHSLLYWTIQLILENKNLNSSVFWKKVGFLVAANQLELMISSGDDL